MEETTTDLVALGETVVFLNHFKEMPDRRQRGKVVYSLEEVLLLALLAVLAGADGFTDIARFGVKKLELLRRFRPFADGTPPHDTLGDIFASLDPHAFQRCFVGWVAALTKTPAEVIAIDGKTLRRSYQKKGAKDPIHMGVQTIFSGPLEDRCHALSAANAHGFEAVAHLAALHLMQQRGHNANPGGSDRLTERNP